jgi:hypothetical protein
MTVFWHSSVQLVEVFLEALSSILDRESPCDRWEVLIQQLGESSIRSDLALAMGEIDSDQNRRLKKTSCHDIAWNGGRQHTRLAGRDDGVAGRYTRMWLGGTP